jgi:hypothetical protein
MAMLNAVELLEKDNTYSEIKTSMVGPVIDYVKKYKVAGGFYNDFINNSSVKSNAAVKAKVISLQSNYKGWMENKLIKNELMKKLCAIAYGKDSLPNDVDLERIANLNDSNFSAFNSNKTNPFGSGTPTNLDFYHGIFRKVYGYEVKEYRNTPARLNLGVTGEIGEYTALNKWKGDGASLLAIFTPIEGVEAFKEPAKETVPGTYWEAAKFVLDGLEITGEDTMEEYLLKQGTALRSRTNEEGKNGYYRLKQVLDEVEKKVEIYRKLAGNANRQVTLALVKWYNAIVDYGAQYIRNELQEYINTHLDQGSEAYTEIGAETGAGSNWKAEDLAGSDTMLKHMQLNDNNTISWLAASDGSGELRKISQLRSDFFGKEKDGEDSGKIKSILSNKVGILGTLARDQDAVTNLLEQYMALTEEQKKSYNTQTIKVYIDNFRGNIKTNLYDGDEEGNVGTGDVGNDLPLATRKLLGQCLRQLENLYNGFDSISITQEINKFYDWFINVEQLYYDWRINSVSRAALVKQLEKIRAIRYAFQLPPVVPEGEEVTAEKVEIRGPDTMDNAQMKLMMDKVKEALDKIRPVVNGLSEQNPVALTTGTGSQQAEITAAKIALENTNIDVNSAKEYLRVAKDGKEFWSEDDYDTCKKIIDELLAVATEISNKGNVVPTSEEVTKWKNALANSVEISGMANSAAYLPRVTNHITDIVDYVNLFNIALPTDGAAEKYKVLGQRYGFTGDCDQDQVAVIRMMDNIRATIEEEFRGANENRGSELLAAKLSGRPVKFAVRDIMEDGYGMRKYHQAWLDFERYSSFLIANFICQNTTATPAKSIRTLNGVQTITNAFKDGNSEGPLTVLKGIQKQTSYGGSLMQLDLEEAKSSSGNGWKLSQEKMPKVVPAEYTQIDYNTQEMDYGLDCLRVYREYFGEYLSPLQRTRQYMAAQGAYLDVMDYIHQLVERYKDWKRDSAENDRLRSDLTQLQGSDLYQQVDMSYKIGMKLAGTTERNSVAAAAIGQCYCSQIGVTVNGSAGTLVDYIATLCQGLISYSRYEDPELIYEDRLQAIDSAVATALGGTHDHQVLLGVAKNTLLPGGTVIADKDKMKTLINQLETLVKSWNRSDEAATQKVFQEMNKDGVYFSQGANYVYQGESMDKSRYPREGTVKTIAGDTTTFETCSEGNVTATETKATMDTVRHRILTNELLDVIDELKSLYVNSEAIAKVSETKNQLQMAECYHAVVGTAGQNKIWHAPVSTLAAGKFLRNDGCYTFQVGTQNYICGMAKGELKIAKVPENTDAASLVNILKNVNKTPTEKSDAWKTFLQAKDASWFEGLVDEKGIYYQFSGDGKTLSNIAFSVVTGGRTYTSRGSGISDDLGNQIMPDKEGFFWTAKGSGSYGQ